MENQLEIFEPQTSEVIAPIINPPVDMLQYAISQGAAIDVIERLMNLQEQTRQQKAKAAFDRAISAAKSEIPVILKTQKVDFTNKAGSRTNYQFEDLAEISKVVDPILSKHGLSYRFRTETDSKLKVTCIVSHQDGYSEENSLAAPYDDSGNKNPIQQIGSTQTYLQRYTLKAALGLAAAKDDDARFKKEVEVQYITMEQVTSILELIEETNTDIDKFCVYYKIKAIADIEAKDFDRIIKTLEKKKVV